MPATNPDTTSENPGFYALALQDPQRMAFIGPQGEETTFGELGAQVNRISHGLRALGVSKEDMVAILVHNGREYIELALATLQRRRAGLVQAPAQVRVPPGLPADGGGQAPTPQAARRVRRQQLTEALPVSARTPV